MFTCLSKGKKEISVSIFFLLLVSNSFGIQSQTTLAPGDIALLSYSADTSPISRYFDFVLLIDIEPETRINFTDAGFFSGTLNTLNESMIRFTSTTSLQAGTIIHWNSATTDSRFSNDPDDEFSGSFTLAGGGDSLIIYQGAISNPTFLFALNNTDNEASESHFAAGKRSSGDTQLPTGLSLGINALGTNANTTNGGKHQDNAAYIGSMRSGTPEALLAAISNVDNWTFDNSQSAIAPLLPTRIEVIPTDDTHTLSTEDRSRVDEIVFSPNPVSDILTMYNTTALDLHLVSVFDRHGRLVKQQKLYPNKVQQLLDLASFPAGFYSIRLDSKSSSISKKVLIN